MRPRSRRLPTWPRRGEGPRRGTLSPPRFLPVHTVVAQAVKADVGEVREAVVLRSDPYPRQQLSRDGAHHVDARVVTAVCPQLGAFWVELQHVRAAAAGDLPFGVLLGSGEIDHRDRALEP